MVRLARLLVVALIAVFAAWSVAHVASATTMSMDMAAMDAAADGGVESADCDACGPAEAGDKVDLASCSIACASPVLAELAATQGLALAPAFSSHAARPVRVLAGRAHSPDPFPPRSILLI